MANRLNPLLRGLIYENQSGFVSGRPITNNVMLSQEIVHDISNLNNGGNVVLKLDMAKAYDRLSWSFLISCYVGLALMMIDVIWRSISNVWYSIIVNSTKHGFFTSSQCLKQGDPISPYLFIIAAKVLSRSPNSLLHNNAFIPFSMHRNGPQITHLTYGDDDVIFSSGNTKSIKLIMKQIMNYECVSGQKDNWTELGPLAHICSSYITARNAKNKVNDFMITNRWDAQKLYNTLPNQIALHIISIELGHEDKNDYAIWNDTEDGHFTNGSA
uniref:Reverse transcriptase domain-containing protein n=1 Tax=Nicotiana tabacum TaxID=4097 RepID=A0A1S3ZYJ9_TOBAC|nr:PREDICTED: uncharacterized protein LOC107791806 [Nicotiana tabacum]